MCGVFFVFSMRFFVMTISCVRFFGQNVYSILFCCIVLVLEEERPFTVKSMLISHCCIFHYRTLYHREWKRCYIVII